MRERCVGRNKSLIVSAHMFASNAELLMEVLASVRAGRTASRDNLGGYIRAREAVPFILAVLLVVLPHAPGDQLLVGAALVLGDAERVHGRVESHAEVCDNAGEIRDCDITLLSS